MSEFFLLAPKPNWGTYIEKENRTNRKKVSVKVFHTYCDITLDIITEPHEWKAKIKNSECSSYFLTYCSSQRESVKYFTKTESHKISHSLCILHINLPAGSVLAQFLQKSSLLLTLTLDHSQKTVSNSPSCPLGDIWRWILTLRSPTAQSHNWKQNHHCG